MREFPASPTLASAIFLHRQAGEPNRQNAQLSLSLGESVTAAQLKDSWNAVIAANSALSHGILPATGTEVILRETDAPGATWQHHDWAAKERTEIPALWTAVQVGELNTPFSLETPPLLRGTTIDLPGGPTHLLLTFPSFLLDDEALFALTGQFLQALDGQTPTAGSAAEQGQNPSSETIGWWTKILQDAKPTTVEIRPRPLNAANGWGIKSILQSREESRAIRDAATILDVTAHQIFLGVAAVVFGRLGGTPKGLLLANTSASSQLLPSPFSLKGEQSAEDFLKKIAQTETERAAQSQIALPRTLALAKPPLTGDDLAAAFVWSPALLADRIHDTWMRWMNVDAKLTRPAPAPLTLEIRNAGRFSIELHFDHSLYSAEEAGLLFDRYLQVLNAVTADPGTSLKDLPILLEGESTPIAGANGHTPSAAKRIEERFLEVAGKNANELAVQGEDEAGLTYSEVRDHARSLAGYLRQENVAEGWMIAICLMPTPWVPVATLGVLLAGDTCVPLNPEASASWLAEKATACDAEIVICDSQTAPLFAGTTRRLLVIDQQWELISAAPASTQIAPAPKTAFLLLGTEQDPAPELNTISPALLAAATKESLARWRLKSGAKLPLTGAPGTGTYLETLVTALNSGATLTLTTGREAASLLASQPTHLRLTEAQWRGLILDLERGTVTWPEATHAVCVETSTVSAALFAKWQGLVGEDTATHFFWSPLSFSGLGLRSFTKGRDPQGEQPIGSPTQGITAKLADACQAELPPHYAGEANVQLADEPARTWKLRAWKDARGSLYLTPANDIEEKLRHQPGVVDAYVAETTIGDLKQLGAWVVLTAEAAATSDTITRELSTRFPDAERPDFIFTVERFPLTHGGSISADSLPKPTPPPAPKASEPQPATTKPSTPKAQAKAPQAATAAPAAPVAEPAAQEPVASSGVWEPLTLLHKEPGTPILLLLHDLDGDPEQLRPLANALLGDWTLYASRGKTGSSGLRVEDEATTIMDALHGVDPVGPYHIFGAGYGAILAFEVARQLRIAGRAVHYLALAGSTAPALPGSKDWMRSLGRLFGGASKTTIPLSASAQARAQARDAFRAQTLEGPAGIILGPDQGRDVENGWQACAPDAFVERINIPSTQMLTDAGAKRLAVILREWAVPTPDEEG